MVVPEFENPVIDATYQFDPAGRALSHYAGNARILGPHPGLKYAAITDGASQTFVAGEAQRNYKPWGSPLNWRDARLGINRSPDGFGGPWTGGAHLLLADGSVRFVSEKIDPKVLNALETPNGGETIDNEPW